MPPISPQPSLERFPHQGDPQTASHVGQVDRSRRRINVALKADKKAIFTAASKASEAADMRLCVFGDNPEPAQ